jgi:hypothetical protein
MPVSSLRQALGVLKRRLGVQKPALGGVTLFEQGLLDVELFPFDLDLGLLQGDALQNAGQLSLFFADAGLQSDLLRFKRLALRVDRRPAALR